MTLARLAAGRDTPTRASGGAASAREPESPVLALQRQVGNRAVGLLLRQPAATPQAPVVRKQPQVTLLDANRARVVMPDGRRYLVTRVRRPVVKTRRSPIPPGTGFGRDDDRVYVKIEWCRDTKGDIQVGVNAPEVVKEALGEISKGIQKGDGANAIKKAVEDAEIKPSVKFEVARSGAWEVEGEIEMSIEGSGVTGAGGELSVKHGEWDLGLDIRNKDGSTTAGLTVKWTPGRSNRKFTCPTREHVYLGQETSFEAVQESWVPGKWDTRTRKVDKDEEVTRYLYFDYAKAKVDEKRSAGELDELRKNLAGGFRVSLVEGLTSPEGSHAPAPGTRWQGNTRLAQERAKAALERAQRECPDGSCLVGGEDPTRDRLEPELYTLVRDGVDVEGRDLQAAAVEGFLGADAEARHRSVEVMEALQRARTPAERAKIVYPFLRRAEIHLTRRVTVDEQYQVWVGGHWLSGESSPAPEDVERAVIPHFQAQDAVRF